MRFTEISEDADKRKQNALWAQITAHEKAAKKSKDLKRDHHLKMADQLRGQLKTSDNVAEGAGNIGQQIKAAYQKIYNAGDDAVEFAYYDSPIFAQYWDEYEGDLDSIIAEVDPSELQIILDELTAAAEDQGVAEGLGKDMATLGGIATLGIAGGLAGNYADQQQPKVEVGGKIAFVEPAHSRVPDTAMTLTGKDGKTYRVWATRGTAQSPHRYHAVPVQDVKEGGENWIKLPNGNYRNTHTGVTASRPPVNKVRGYKWEVHFDYGPHMSDSVVVTATSENEARAKAEKAAQKAGRSIMINWAKPAEQGVAESQHLNKLFRDYRDSPEADIDKKIEFHKRGQAAAQYKGSMNKMHAKKIRELEAKKQASKQGVAETRAGSRMSDMTVGSPKIVHKNGRAVGEIGLDHDPSPGQGPFYMKHYETNTWYSGYDTKKEALDDLKHVVQQMNEQGVAEAFDLHAKSTSNTNSSPEFRGVHVPGAMKHPDWKEPTWSFQEIAQKLGVSTRELNGLVALYPGFPTKAQGIKSKYGSGAYYPRSEVKRWVNATDIRNILKSKKGMAEGKPDKPEPPEADYGDDYQAMVSRVKKLAGLGPLKTVYDPAKRVYKNVPTAVQPGDKK